METTPKKIDAEMRKALKYPLPQGALKQHGGKTFLSSINPIYIVERLNDVFGVGAWRTTYEVQLDYAKERGMPVVKCILEIPEYGVYIESFGGSKNDDMGDMYKGSQTDALTKAASYLEIGIDVYKGQQSHKMPTKSVTPPAVEPNLPKKVDDCKQCGLPMKYVPAGVSKKTNKAYKAFYSCEQCKLTTTA